MDCETRPTNRTAIRSMAKHVRRMFGCRSDDEPFPVLHALELLPDLFPNTTYNIVADTDLPAMYLHAVILKQTEDLKSKSSNLFMMGHLMIISLHF